MTSLGKKAEVGQNRDASRQTRPPSFARAAMLLFAAAAALSLSSGAIFLEGGARLAVWMLPMVFALVVGLRELNHWRRSGGKDRARGRRDPPAA